MQNEQQHHGFHCPSLGELFLSLWNKTQLYLHSVESKIPLWIFRMLLCILIAGPGQHVNNYDCGAWKLWSVIYHTMVLIWDTIYMCVCQLLFHKFYTSLHSTKQIYNDSVLHNAQLGCCSLVHSTMCCNCLLHCSFGCTHALWCQVSHASDLCDSSWVNARCIPCRAHCWKFCGVGDGSASCAICAWILWRFPLSSHTSLSACCQSPEMKWEFSSMFSRHTSRTLHGICISYSSNYSLPAKRIKGTMGVITIQRRKPKFPHNIIMQLVDHNGHKISEKKLGNKKEKNKHTQKRKEYSSRIWSMGLMWCSRICQDTALAKTKQ